MSSDAPQPQERIACEFCDRNFNSTRGLNTHIGAIHGGSHEYRRQLLADLRDFAKAIGDVPTHRGMRESGPHAPDRYTTEFGSWNDAIKAAGLEVVNYRSVPKEELLDALKKFADELGRAPTSDDLYDDGPYSDFLYWRRFGSVSNALEEAGLTPSKRYGIPKDELLEELVAIADEVGRTPTMAEFDALSEYGTSTYRYRWDSWNDAILASGLEPRKQGVTTLDRQAVGSYGPNWDEQRRKALDRDGWQCRLCEMTNEMHKEVYTYGLEVHHVIPIRCFRPFDSAADYERANDLSNLRTVCCPCHHEWEGVPVFPE